MKLVRLIRIYKHDFKSIHKHFPDRTKESITSFYYGEIVGKGVYNPSEFLMPPKNFKYIKNELSRE